MPSATINGITDSPAGVKIEDRRAINLKVIPKEWILDPALLKGLQTPWEKSKNNMIALDLPRESGILSDRELEITGSYSVQRLLEEMASGELTSIEVVTAFCKRAAIAHQVTNCLTEIFFDKALERAQYVDAERSKGNILGPLHGLPISVKECFHVKGIPTTLGLRVFADRVATKNSAAVNLLLDQGAVIFCKTNIPQTMMSSDSENYLFGRTLNPINTMLTAGGSSGGEGALVAFRGSPVGLGTDIAGSIRIPSFCCGTYGFRPTANRVPYGGQQSVSTPGLKPISACAGPLANSIDALEVFMKSTINARPAAYDSRAFDLPWRDVSGSAKASLRIGVVPEDPVFPIHPPIKRALQEAITKLESQGHEIVWLASEECHVAHATMVAWSLMGLDHHAETLVTDGGEKKIYSRVRIEEEQEKIDWSYLAGIEEEPTLQRLAALNVKQMEIANDWEQIWQRNRLDAAISVPAQSSAVEHDEYGMPPYTQFLNLIDYPACVIPCGEVDAKVDEEPFMIKPGQSAPAYNPDNLDGAPCSIQIFTQKMRDEECIQAARVVDQCLRQ